MEDIRIVLSLAMHSESPRLNRLFLHELEGADEDMYEDFCDHFELPNWFFDLLMEHEVDLVTELDTIVDERRK